MLTERWRVYFNTERPHSSLGYKPPAPAAWQTEASQRSGKVESKKRFPLSRCATLTISLVQITGQATQFCDILRITRGDFGIVPNYTTNSRGLTEEIITATARYAGAVAVSAYAPYADTLDAVVRLKQAGVTTNLHFILTSRSVETAIEWLRTPPEVLTSADAIVFLNYKPVGRSADESLLLNKSSRVGEFFELATESGYPFRIGFDTCTITGLARLGKAPKVTIEGCDAGRFSLFVSEDMEVYPCSFMVEAGYRGVSLRNTTLRDIWLTHPSFAGIRAKHRSGGCVECTALPICLSGCPLFPEMNLCPSKYSKINSGPATAR